MAALDQRCTGDCPAGPAGLYCRAATGVALLAKDWATGFAPCLAGGAAVQTRRAGRTVASAALVKRGHSGAAMPAHNRLALTAIRPAERYLIHQAAH
jgi:hypothetical protein